MNTYSIADLEKALAYAKKQNSLTVTIEVKELDNRRLLIGVMASYKGEMATITVYSAESSKLPTITHTETLFA